jgi:hypothetical protein
VIDHVFKTWSYGVMVSVLHSCVIDHVFKTWSCGVMVSVLPSCVIDHVSFSLKQQCTGRTFHHTWTHYPDL